MKRIDREFFEVEPLTCAQALIGCQLVWQQTGGIIVETEAYAAIGDRAAHTFMRTLARSFVAENPPGSLYVYLNYGIHWLLNFLVKGPQENGFVLIRALRPTRGIELMEERRKTKSLTNLCSGPGKLTQAFGIDGQAHGADFFSLPDATLSQPNRSSEVHVDRRIGITKSAELEWRFLLAHSPYVSVRKTRLRPS
jgi:DNA-3-methyladenine glycosylase